MAFLFLTVLYLFVLSCRSVVNNDESQSAVYAVDTFYDEDVDENWVVLSSAVTDEFEKEWDEDEKWDKINEHIGTTQGRYINRKCQNVFGHSLCLCDFESWQEGATPTKYNCHKQGQKEEKKQTMLRSAQSMKYNANLNYPNAFFPNSARGRNGFGSMAKAMHPQHPYLKMMQQQQQIADANQIEENKHSTIEDLLIEQEEIEEELESNLENEIYREQILEEDLSNNIDNAVDGDYNENVAVEEEEFYEDALAEEQSAQQEYYEEVVEELDVVEDEIEIQDQLIEEQKEVIQELKKENAYQEQLIDILEEEDDDDYEEQNEEFESNNDDDNEWNAYDDDIADEYEYEEKEEEYNEAYNVQD
eukprot:37722_1